MTTTGLIGALYPYDGAFCLLWASSCLFRWLRAVYQVTSLVHWYCPFVELLLLPARLLGNGGLQALIICAGCRVEHPLAMGPT